MATETTTKDGDDTQVTGRELSFYEVDASVIDNAARKLLIEYAEVGPEDVDSHVDTVVRFP